MTTRRPERRTPESVSAMTPELQRIRRARDRAGPEFDAQDFLHAEIGRRLLDRLNAIRIDPMQIVDLGAGTPSGAAGIAARFPAARIAAIDFSAGMLARGEAAAPRIARLCADGEALPLRTGSVDLVLTNLFLQHYSQPDGVFAEIRRLLRYPGLLMFATLGPGSLRELRTAWSAADRFGHVGSFIDMHDLGDLLVARGFAEPVMYSETLTVRYRDPRSLIGDLRAAGSVNVAPDRNPGLTGRAAWRRMTEACLATRGEDGRFPVSVEVVYGVAWTGERPAGTDGEIEVPLDRLSKRR